MMISAKFIFFLMCLEKIAQVATMEFSLSMNWKNNFILVKPGQNLTLPCLYRDKDTTKISWFKQSLKEKPRHIFVSYRSTETFYNDFKNNPRFKLHNVNNEANLTITDLELSDSATYYCAIEYFYAFDFTESYHVIVEGSGLTINELASESIHSGGSGTLTCTVHTGTCDEDHTVYWFRDSGPPQLELVYRSRNNHCEKKTNTCFYSQSMKNLNISQAETYYCAVAACGRILFEKETKLEFEDKGNLLVWVYYLSAASIFTIIVVVFLSSFIFMMKKRSTHHSLDPQSKIPAASTANTEGDQEEDNLHYATVRVDQPNRSKRQWNTQNQCVYSGVRQ